jgi:OmcA/MtrC family decaheme c-type cytochrome
MPSTAHRAKWEDVTYPGRVSNCLGCHNDGTFYSARPVARAISTVVNVETLWNDDVATSTTSFACSTCHTDDTAKAHMSQNGGLFDAAKTMPQLGAETCTICHGPGGIADVGEVHNVEEL